MFIFLSIKKQSMLSTLTFRRLSSRRRRRSGRRGRSTRRRERGSERGIETGEGGRAVAGKDEHTYSAECETIAIPDKISIFACLGVGMCGCGCGCVYLSGFQCILTTPPRPLSPPGVIVGRGMQSDGGAAMMTGGETETGTGTGTGIGTGGGGIVIGTGTGIGTEIGGETGIVIGKRIHGEERGRVQSRLATGQQI